MPTYYVLINILFDIVVMFLDYYLQVPGRDGLISAARVNTLRASSTQRRALLNKFLRKNV